jgi:hypothetical protein
MNCAARYAIVSVAGLLVSIIQPTVVGAQVEGARQLEAFTKTAAYGQLLNRALATLPDSVFKRCPTFVSGGSQVTILKPPSFGSDGSPISGYWVQRVPVSGCGNDTVLTFFFSAGADGKTNIVIGVPGATHANLTLQRDAFRYASIGAGLAAKDCKTFVVKNTKFESYGLQTPATPDPGPGQHLRPWWETWTMIGCSKTIDVPIDFVPDEKGAQIIQPGGAIVR